MIDRGAGNRSLLAEFGLPTDVSQVDHPQVTGYDFVYRNADDVKYRQVIDWMNKSLKQPEPDYSAIKFDPPRQRLHGPRRCRRDERYYCCHAGVLIVPVARERAGQVRLIQRCFRLFYFSRFY